MSKVYANSKEVSGKATPNKSPAAPMSVCLSPPSPPAGPVPVPYPMTSTASDTSDGTGSVKIRKKEVGKKNGSNYSKSSGNQPATRSFGMDVVSHTLEGKTKFEAYSMDVQFEKGGAERFMDLTTSNHGAAQGVATIPSTAGSAEGGGDSDCERLEEQVNAMREATDAEAAAQRQRDAAELKAASSSRNRQWQARVESRIWSRQQGAHTSCLTPDGTMRNYTSSAVNRDALRQRGFNVESQRPINGKRSNVCKGASEPYADKFDKCHTEAQILENINWRSTPPVPGSITIATNWPATIGGQPDPQRANRPCPESCQPKMKEACKCGLQIFVCVEGSKEDFCAQNA